MNQLVIVQQVVLVSESLRVCQMSAYVKKIKKEVKISERTGP